MQRLADVTLTLPVHAVQGLDRTAEAVSTNADAGRLGKVLLRP